MDRELVQDILDYQEKGEKLALATVISVKGSSPRDRGAQMLITAAEITGTIGGGAVEGQVVEKAREILKNGKDNERLSFDLTNQDVAAAGGICGGNVEVFIEVLI